MKSSRHAVILKLINSCEIETQDMLADQLIKHGIEVTQATISRDIKELRLIKVLTDHNTYKYATADKLEKTTTDRLMRIFTESVLSITDAENIIVVKTLPASASVVAEAIDSMGWDEIAGTLAGENSIFVAIRSKAQVHTVMERFNALMA